MAALDYKSNLARYRRYLQTVESKPLWQASLYFIFSLILLIVLLAAALRPTLVTIASLLGQIRQQREIEQKLDAKIVAITRAQDELNRISARMVTLDQSLPIDPDVSQWTAAVARVTSETGLIMDDISVGSIVFADTSTQSASMQFEVGATGSYDQIAQFLSVLEGLRRLIKIENISLSPVTPESIGPAVIDPASLHLDVTGVLSKTP